jgi:hypothetical protein
VLFVHKEKKLSPNPFSFFYGPSHKRFDEGRELKKGKSIG